MAIIAATVLAVAATVATSIAVTIVVAAAAIDIDVYAAELADATFFSCPKKFITQTN